MTLRKFAGIVDGDVFTIYTMDSEFEGIDGQAGERIIAGYLSNPIFVEIPLDAEIGINWIWDGTEFKRPEA